MVLEASSLHLMPSLNSIPNSIQQNIQHSAPFRGVEIITDHLKTEAAKTTEGVNKFFKLGGFFERKVLSHIKDLVRREGKGNCYSFKYEEFPDEEMKALMEKFRGFSLERGHPLSNLEKQKISDLEKHIQGKMKVAEANGDASALDRYKQKLARLIKLKEISSRPKATRHHFKTEEWETLDEVDFSITKDNLKTLHALFNREDFKSLQFHEVMKKYLKADFEKTLLAEVLARRLAYIGGLHGKKILLPIREKASGQDKAKAHYRFVEYTIKDFTVGDALPCYILESEDKDANPWFIARGTQIYTGRDANGKEFRKGSFESMLGDAIDPKSIGRHIVIKAMVVKSGNGESLKDLFERWRKEGKRVELAGHSLGAFIVNHISVLFFNRLFPKTVKRAWGFSGPGVGKSLARLYQANLEEVHKSTNIPLKKLRKRIINLATDGDIVPSGGHEMIGYNLSITPKGNHSRKSLASNHAKHGLSNDFIIQKIDTKKENQKLARRMCEIFRRIVGLFMRAMLFLFYRSASPDWWVNRKIYSQKFRQQAAEL